MYTLNDLTNDVNSALNYPAISFQDIKLYLNQAISELNSSLHTSIRNVNDIISENYVRTSTLDNLIALSTPPTMSDTVPMYPDTPVGVEITYYYKTTTGKFMKYNSEEDEWKAYDSLYAYNITDGIRTVYKATYIDDHIYWIQEVYDNPLELDFSQYICNDWIVLFVIPYICFKFSARDNDTGAIFSEEFTQGYQQLLIAYNIPDKVLLDKVAGLIPYREDVEKSLPNLKIMCPTRAITESFKIPKDIQATFGSMFDRGGW